MGVIGIALVTGTVLMMVFFFFTYGGTVTQLPGTAWRLPDLQHASFVVPPSPSPDEAPPERRHASLVLPQSSPTAQPPILPAVVTVAITSQGFAPQTITVAPNTVVLFLNQDTHPHWPASDPHPSHTLCAGFDALRNLQQGESYGFTFVTPGLCSYHDHRNPSQRGTIMVR